MRIDFYCMIEQQSQAHMLVSRANNTNGVPF
jgi:hypothetical protein